MEAAGAATVTAAPIGMLVMLLVWLVIPGLVVMFVLLGKRKAAAKRAAAAVSTEKTAADENIDAIEKLAKLHQQGILTDEEFQQKKKMILDKI